MNAPTRDQVIQWARESGDDVDHTLPSDIDFLECFASVAYAAGQAAEREACAVICDELEQHWSDYKDTALLNGDVALSNAASGEPRAARTISAAIRARGRR